MNSVTVSVAHNYQRVNLTWNKFRIKGRPPKRKLGKRLEEFNEQKLTCIKSDLVLTWQMLSAAATSDLIIRAKQRRVISDMEHGN